MSEAQVPGGEGGKLAPSFPRKAQSRVDALTNRFKKTLKDIALGLAYHDSTDSVSVKHVDEAFTTLARAGLSRLRWYQRTEFEAAVGGILLALSSSVPPIVAIFIDVGAKRETISGAGTLLSLILGLVLMFHAFYRARLPVPPEDGVFIKRVLILVTAATAIAILYLALKYAAVKPN
jgi:hypothetical protein